MTKTLTLTLTYDAPPASVVAMLADAAFREQVCDAQHAVSRVVTITGIPGEVSVDMVQATEGTPSFAKKFVGDQVKVSTREEWTSAAAARLHIDSGVSIAQINGSIALAEKGAQTVETVVLTIDVRMPLVGGKIESVVADLMTKAYVKEERLGRAYLAQR